MAPVTVEEAQANLPQILEQLAPGEELIITRQAKPVAQLVALAPTVPHPIPGRCKGMLTIISDDDDHLKDWKEYMP